jgi:hypothetical protein
MHRKPAVIILLCIAPLAAAAAAGSVKLGFGLISDSNVFETEALPESDRLGRLWFDANARIRPSRALGLAVNYSGGVDGYFVHDSESRTVHNLSGFAEVSLNQRAMAGIECQGKVKSFFSPGRGYAAWHAAPFLRWWLLDAVRLKAAGWVAGFDYRPGNVFDFRSSGADLSLEASPFPGFKVLAGMSFSAMTFRRDALDVTLLIFQQGVWIPLGVRQKDRVVEGFITFESYRWAYWLARVSYETSRSNGYGYSYRDPQFDFVFAKLLPWGLNVQLVWMLRRKTYTDPLAPFLQVRPDAEDETHSQAMVDVSKRLKTGWTARFRVARFRNESPFRDLYYQKDIVSLGCTYDF